MSELRAIVLAAGLSRRMGAFKPVLSLGDKTLVEHVIQSFTGTVAPPLIVVTGHRASEVETALLPRVTAGEVVCVHNPAFAQGEMLSSLKAGINALGPLPGGSAFFLAFADQPAVKPETIARLAESWQNTHPLLTLPTYHAQRGHPVLLSIKLIPEILALGPNDSLKLVVHRHLSDALLLETDDPEVVEDVDMPEDFARLVARLNQQPPAPRR